MQKEEKIKISAIINTFNCESTICDTLESLKDLDEIVLIDFHSTDDTIEIAKEYKAKVIYANKNELDVAFNQAVDEVQNEWVFIVQDSEIAPQKLLFELGQYIEKPKKNKFCVTLAQKNFYLKKEIKFLKKRVLLRVFKKGYAKLKNNFSLELKAQNSKIHKFNKNFRIQNGYLYNYIEADILKETENIIQSLRLEFKHVKKASYSTFLKPIKTFCYWYLIKRGVFEKYGFMISAKKAYFEFLKQIMLREKSIKGIENDI